MYNIALNIPRMAPAKLALLHDLFPGLNHVVTVPPLDTEQDVRNYLDRYSMELAGYEYVREIKSLNLNEATQQWEIRLVIGGD